MSSSNTPCAACKLQRRKCTQECVFAPYFPPDDPHKFAIVHKVFGASNVSKLLSELNVAHREEAVKSLAYEAEARLKDPVYGCVGFISVLQHRLKYIQNEVNKARKELAMYIGPQALEPMAPIGASHHGVMIPQHPHQQGNIYGPPVYPYNNMPPQAMAGIPAGAQGGQLVIREPQQQQQQMLEAQLARDVQELFGGYDQQLQPQQQQQDFLRYGGGGGFETGSASVSVNQPPQMSPSLALNTYDNPLHSIQLQQAQGELHPLHHQNQHQPSHHQLQEQLLLPSQEPQPQPLQLQNQHHHHLQEQLFLRPQQPQQQQQNHHHHQPPHHQLEEQLLLPPQDQQQQQQQQNHHHHHQPPHHQLQEQLLLAPQQPQPQQQQQNQHHHQLQEQLLLPPQQPQPQQHQHPQQSEGTDGRSVGPPS